MLYAETTPFCVFDHGQAAGFAAVLEKQNCRKSSAPDVNCMACGFVCRLSPSDAKE